MTANLSGGHITPTVTIATMITGHITLLKGVAYVLCQLVGSVFGSLLIVRISVDDACQALEVSPTHNTSAAPLAQCMHLG
jgi:glycerol uptake facilitator-like aquaporin